MSNEPSTTTGRGSESESTTTQYIPVKRISELFRTDGDHVGDADRVVVGAGLVALVVVSVGVALDVLVNLPFDPFVVPSPLRTIAAVGIPVILTLALVAVSIVAEQSTVRIGLLFVGIFGLLPVASRAATVPAVVAVILGGGVVLLGTNGWPTTYRALRRTLVGAVFVAGTAVSLGSTTGLLDGSARGVGGVLVLGGVTAMAVRTEADRIPIVGGVFAFLLAVFVSAASPYVVGSALLVAFAVAGVPHLLVAFAVGGATTATLAGIRRRDYPLAIGAPIVLLAGVPATVPRALAVILGATLVLVDITVHSDTSREVMST